MKRIVIFVMSCVLGGLLLAGGVFFAAGMHSAYTVSFDKYETYSLLRGERIFCPSFISARPWGYAPSLTYCYREVEGACTMYANLVYKKYDGKADLDFTVERDGNLLTIKFTGIGYPENGGPEPLERTYIFDIEGVGADKLPKLLNRAEIIGY